ncbi:hypothetical protein [Amorphus sp. MBR-141]
MTEHPCPLPYRYRMSGLNVASEIALPQRTAVGSNAAFDADVTMHVGDVPASLEQAAHEGPNWSVDARSFLLDLPGIGRFMASEGSRLTVCPAPGVPVDDILVFATGTALSAILYQRGAMLLHGSAVVHDGRAFVFCGPSGAGKSTLSGALWRAGCSFLSDDLCSVTQAADGTPLIEPDGRTLRLYRDSIDRLKLADAVGPPVRQRVDKFHVAPRSEATERAAGVPLGAIYMLADTNPAQPAGIVEFPPLVAAQALLRQAYRRRLALAYSAKGQLAARTAALLSHARVYHLRRPRDLARLDEMVDDLTAHWARLS